MGVLRKARRSASIAEVKRRQAGLVTPKTLAADFATRVAADGGVTESQSCMEDRIKRLKSIGMWQKASAVWLPHGYKEGKLYAAKGGANADLGFTRGGTRTRKGATYLEQVPYNLLQYSEEFNQGAWTGGSSALTITANQIANPIDGEVTADLIAADGTANQHYTGQIAWASGGNHVATIYAKANTANFIHFMIGGANTYVQFSLSTGALVYSGAGTGTIVSATSEDIGNGWFKFKFIARHTFGSTVIWRIYPLAASQNSSGPSETSTASMYVYRAQITKGDAELDYFKTTNRQNVPALDYTNDTCPALSLEPARTNLLLQSETFDAANWSKGTAASITANNISAPDNLSTADKLTSSSTASSAYVLQNATVSASTTYTFSIYVKKGNETWCNVTLHDGGIVGKRRWFNLDTGALGSETLLGAGLATTSPIVRSMPNGFWRIEWSITMAANTTLSCICHPAVNADGSIASDLNDYGYLWGAQLEAGSYATSYIPTTTATVSRVADAVTAKTGFTDYIGQTEGTLFFEGSSFADSVADVFLSVNDATLDNRIQFFFSGANVIRLTIVTGGVTVADIQNAGFISGQVYKMCAVYRNNYAALFVDGVKIGEDLSLTIPVINQITMNDGTGSFPFYGNGNAWAISKTAISDAEAITLTTP